MRRYHHRGQQPRDVFLNKKATDNKTKKIPLEPSESRGGRWVRGQILRNRPGPEMENEKKECDFEKDRTKRKRTGPDMDYETE